MNHSLIKTIGEYIEERTDRIGEDSTTIYSVTNERGFVRSLDLFDKQVFSADTGNYKQVEYQDLAYNPSRINVGSVAMCEDKNGGAVSPMYCIVRCRPGLLPRYLLRFLKSEVGISQIRHRCEGAVRFQLKYRDLSAIPIYLPSLSEQERIVTLLDEADNLRKLRARTDQRTDSLIPALFHKMFGEQTKESKGWPVVELGHVCDFIGGSSLPAGVPFVGQSDGLLLLKVGDMNEVGNETFITTSREWIGLDVSTYSRARRGTIVIPKRGGAIATNKKRMLLRDALLDPNLMGIYPDTKKLTADYLYEWFRLFDLTRITSGSAVPQLNKQDLAPLQIAMPPLSIQIEFTKNVNEIREMEAVQSASRQRLDDLFQSMLHRAFKGEL